MSKMRSLTNKRREGQTPQPLPYKIQTEESIRLAKKINGKVFKHLVNVNEADRVVSCKKPKHLFSGKRGNGKNERR
jgi:nucleolar GTP-binding protein